MVIQQQTALAGQPYEFTVCLRRCRHRAINLFLMSYKEQWLQVEPPGHDSLIEDIAVRRCVVNALVPAEA